MIGIDPSKQECAHAEERLAASAESGETHSFEVIPDYFSPELGLKSVYDAFCTFQVFEHLEDPLTVLAYAGSLMKDDGVGLINVPDGKMIFENGYFHQVVGQHINYYSPLSMEVLLNRAGLQIIDLEEHEATMEMNVYVGKKTLTEPLSDIVENVEKQLYALLQSRPYAVWGAGAKTLRLASVIPKDTLRHIFDSDSSKEGKYIAGIDIPVEGFQNDPGDIEAVFIAAASYSKEIAETLRGGGYTGEIVVLDGKQIVQI